MLLQLSGCTVDLDTGEVVGPRPGRLSPRERTLLAYLAAQPHTEVPREELLHDVFGYHRNARSRAVDKAMSSLRRKVEVDGSAPEHLRTTAGGYVFLPEAPRQALRSNAFLGREEELQILLQQVAETGLCTVVGTPGVGKSRLASEVLARCSHGVRLHCDLREVLTEADLLLTVAQALRCPPAPNSRALGEQIAAALGALDRGVLLLDGFERLVEHRGWVRQWRAASAHLTLLVTSQCPLGLEGERLVRVAPLAPEDGASMLQARAAERGVVLIRNAAVAELAERLDHLPLALELAAARLDIFTPAELVERLGQRLDLLRNPVADAPPHQATLRGMLDAAFSMCTPAEMTAFAELGVFVGPFDLAAAEAVLSRPEDGRLVSDVFAELVHRSLVHRSADASQASCSSTYQLLETLQVYAGEQLQGLGEVRIRELEAAHGRHYAMRVCPHGPMAVRDTAADAAGYARWRSNLLAAHQRALLRSDAKVGLCLAEGLWTVMSLSGSATQQQELLEEALTLPLDLRGQTWLRVLWGMNLIHVDVPSSIELLQQAVVDARSAGDAELECRALRVLIAGLGIAGRTEEALWCGERALSLVQQGVLAGTVRHTLAQLNYDLGRAEEALAMNEAGLRDFVEGAHATGIAHSHQLEGMILCFLGQYEEATSSLESARQRYRALGWEAQALRSEGTLAWVDGCCGQVERAIATHRRVADAYGAIGATRGRVAYLLNLTSCLLDLSRVEEAREVLAELGQAAGATGRDFVATAGRLEARCHLAEGFPHQALQRLGPRTESPSLAELLLRAEVHLELSNLEVANTLIEEVEDRMRGQPFSDQSRHRRDLAALTERLRDRSGACSREG